MQVDVLWTSPTARPAFEPHLMSEGYSELAHDTLSGVNNVRQERRDRSDRPTQENYPRLTFEFTDGSTRVGYGRLVSASGTFGSVSAVTFYELWEELRTKRYENVVGATWVTRENKMEEWEELEIVYWKPESEVFGLDSIMPDYVVIDRPDGERGVRGSHPLHYVEIGYESESALCVEGQTDSGESVMLENVYSVSPERIEMSRPDESKFRVHSESGVLHKMDSIEDVKGRTGRFQTVISDESYTEVKTRFGFLGGTANEEGVFAVTVNGRFGSPSAAISRSSVGSGFHDSKDYYSVRSGARERLT